MSRPLDIVVGVTGGIAAYKAVQVVRDLVLAGHTVRVIATESALRFVGAPTWEAISRQPLNTSLFEEVAAVRHVALGQQADVIVIAPATANTIAKLAAGMADDLLGTTVLASRAPLVLAPAMHTEMWQHPATAANIQTLRARGVSIVGPESGRLTGPDVGLGRMSEPDRIVAAVLAAGTGAAPLEPARSTRPRRPARAGHGGRHTGADRPGALSGQPLERQAGSGLRPRGRGAGRRRDGGRRPSRRWSGGRARGCRTGRPIPVGTAAELAFAVEDEASTASVVIMAAAVADYTPSQVAERKIKKTERGEQLEIVLTRTKDVLGELVAHPVPGRVVVGFAAETAEDRDELVALGREKIARKPADLLVANAVGNGRGFGAEDNSAVVLAASGEIVLEVSGSKRAVADAVLDRVVELLAQ